MSKRIALGLLGLFLLLFLAGFLLPTHFHVEERIPVVAAPRMIFAFVGDLNRWREWQSWYEADPKMQTEISTPPYGRGATSRWNSSKMGKGEISLTDWNQERDLSYQMQIEGWHPSTGKLSLLPAPQGAVVEWTMDGEVGESPISRYMGLIMRFFVSRDFRQGLSKLKKVCESHAASEIQAPWSLQ